MADETKMDMLERALTVEPTELPDGKPTFATLNRSRYRDLIWARAQRAKVGLKGYVEWSIQNEGISPARAEMLRALAWAAYEETDGNPGSKFYDEIWLDEVKYQHLLELRRAIKSVASWLMATSKAPKDQEWARDQLRLTLNAPFKTWANPSPSRIRPRGKTKDNAVHAPCTTSEMDSLLLTIDEQSAGWGAKVPWHRDVLRMTLLTASTPEAIIGLRRHDLVMALADGKKGWFELWRRPRAPGERTRRRAVPVRLVRDEAKRLIAWPWEWVVLADLIYPHTDAAISLRGSVTILRRHIRRAVLEALPPGPSRSTVGWIRKIHHWVYAELFRVHRDWVLLSQFSGLTIENLKNHDYLRDIEHSWDSPAPTPATPSDDPVPDLVERSEGDGDDQAGDDTNDLKAAIAGPVKV